MAAVHHLDLSAFVSFLDNSGTRLPLLLQKRDLALHHFHSNVTSISLLFKAGYHVSVYVQLILVMLFCKTRRL